MKQKLSCRVQGKSLSYIFKKLNLKECMNRV